jgi:hypothetical protein
MMQAVLPPMRAQREGAIVNISSGTTRRVIPGVGAYAATKSALNMRGEAEIILPPKISAGAESASAVRRARRARAPFVIGPTEPTRRASTPRPPNTVLRPRGTRAPSKTNIEMRKMLCSEADSHRMLLQYSGV